MLGSFGCLRGASTAYGVPSPARHLVAMPLGVIQHGKAMADLSPALLPQTIRYKKNTLFQTAKVRFQHSKLMNLAFSKKVKFSIPGYTREYAKSGSRPESAYVARKGLETGDVKAASPALVESYTSAKMSECIGALGKTASIPELHGALLSMEGVAWSILEVDSRDIQQLKARLTLELVHSHPFIASASAAVNRDPAAPIPYMRILAASAAAQPDGMASPAVNEFLDKACKLAAMRHTGPLHAFLRVLFGELDLVECEYIRTYLRLRTQMGIAKARHEAILNDQDSTPFQDQTGRLLQAHGSTQSLERRYRNVPVMSALLRHRLALVAWNAWNGHIRARNSEDLESASLRDYAKDAAVGTYARSAINAARNGFFSDAVDSRLAAVDRRLDKFSTWVARAKLPGFKRAIIGFFRKSPFYRQQIGLGQIGTSSYHSRAQEAFEIAPRALKAHESLFRFQSNTSMTQPLEYLTWEGHNVQELIFERVLLKLWPQISLFAVRCGELSPDMVTKMTDAAVNMARENFGELATVNTRQYALKWFSDTPLRRETLLAGTSNPSEGRNILRRISKEFSRQASRKGFAQESARIVYSAEPSPSPRPSRLREQGNRPAGGQRAMLELFTKIDALPRKSEVDIKNEAALEYAWTKRITDQFASRMQLTKPLRLLNKNDLDGWYQRQKNVLQKACKSAQYKADAEAMFQLESKERTAHAALRRELVVLERAYARVSTAVAAHAGTDRQLLAKRINRIPELRMHASLEMTSTMRRLKNLLISAKGKQVDVASVKGAMRALGESAKKLQLLVPPDGNNNANNSGDDTVSILDSRAQLQNLERALALSEHAFDSLNAEQPSLQFRIRRKRIDRVERTLVHIQESMELAYDRKKNPELNNIGNSLWARWRKTKNQRLIGDFQLRLRRKDPVRTLEAAGDHGMQLGDGFQFFGANALRANINTSMASLALTLGLARVGVAMGFGRRKAATFGRSVNDARAQLQVGVTTTVHGSASVDASVGILGKALVGVAVEGGAARSDGEIVSISLERDGSLEVKGKRVGVSSRGDPFLNGWYGLGRSLRALGQGQGSVRKGGQGVALHQLAMEPQLSISAGTSETFSWNLGAGLIGSAAQFFGFGVTVTGAAEKREMRETKGSSQMHNVQVSSTFNVGGATAFKNVEVGAFLGSLAGLSYGDFQCKVRFSGTNMLTRGEYKAGKSARTIGITSIAMLKRIMTKDVKEALAQNLMRTRPQNYADPAGVEASRRRAIAEIDGFVSGCEKFAVDANGNWEAFFPFELTNDGAAVWNKCMALDEAGLLDQEEKAALGNVMHMPEKGDLDDLQRLFIDLSNNPTLGVCLVAAAQTNSSHKVGIGIVKESGKFETANILVK
jgi:hypothetical protein